MRLCLVVCVYTCLSHVFVFRLPLRFPCSYIQVCSPRPLSLRFPPCLLFPLPRPLCLNLVTVLSSLPVFLFLSMCFTFCLPVCLSPLMCQVWVFVYFVFYFDSLVSGVQCVQVLLPHVLSCLTRSCCVSRVLPLPLSPSCVYIVPVSLWSLSDHLLTILVSPCLMHSGISRHSRYSRLHAFGFFPV